MNVNGNELRSEWGNEGLRVNEVKGNECEDDNKSLMMNKRINEEINNNNNNNLMKINERVKMWIKNLKINNVNVKNQRNE